MQLDADQLRLLRLHGQYLSDTARHTGAPDSLLHNLVGLQAQERSAAALGVCARSRNMTDDTLVQTQYVDRRLLRTWAMRGTLHLIAAADAGWLTALLGPIAMAGYRRRRAALGLEEATLEAAIAALCRHLATNGPQTRTELREVLGAQGFPVAGQAIVHLIMAAAMRGLICEGPQHAGEPVYVCFADWIDRGAPIATETAAAELFRRYLVAYAPATPEDFASWSGLGREQVRAAWRQVAAECIEVQFERETLWLPRARAAELDADPVARGSVRLLPAYDTLLLCYNTRDLIVAPTHARAIHPGGGVLRATLLIDGQVAGIWGMQRQRNRVVVRVEPFAPLSETEQAALAAEVARIGRFLGMAATVDTTPLLRE